MRPLDRTRGIPGIFGLRLFKVTVLVTTWSGSRIGEGTETVVSRRVLTVGEKKQFPKVRKVTQSDIIASGGLYSAQDLVVEPLTPEYKGGGIPVQWIDPPQLSGPTEVIFIVEGPGQPTNGGRYKRIEGGTDRAFHYGIVLRHTGQQ